MPRGATSNQTFRNTAPEFREELVGCPYNMAHQLRPDRLVRHLVICRKESLSSPTSQGYKTAQSIKICPYNSAHHVHRADMEHHLAQCASARQFREQELRELPVRDIQKHVASTAESDDEDWDKEMEGLNLGTYNPMDKVVKDNIPVNAHLLSKAGRRDLRSMQRMGNWEGVSQLVNVNAEDRAVPVSGHVPVGMSCQASSTQKNRKKKKVVKN